MSESPRCVYSHNGYGCKRGADHEGVVHRGADGHWWHTEDSWGYEDVAREALEEHYQTIVSVFEVDEEES